jgi:hypothetical protein
MTGRSATFVVALAVVATALTASIPVTAAQTDVQIQSVGVSVDQPAPGERFTLSVNIANLQTSSGPVDVTDVYVRKGTDEFARIEDTGTIAPGQNLTIPLTMRINDPGSKRLTVHVVVEDSDGDHRRINYPLYIEVEEPDEALLSVADLDPTAGQESAVNITVSNGDAAPISNVQLEVGGDATVKNPERVSASLASGTQTTHTFQVTFPEAGPQQLDAKLTYKTSSGSTRTIQRTVRADVEQATNDPALRASIRTNNGSSVIHTELQQFGNVELHEVQIRALQNDITVARTIVSDVPAKGIRTATLDSSTIPGGAVTVIAEFTAAGEQRTVRETLNYTSDVELDVSNQIKNGSSVIRAELQQFGNVELRDVEIRAESDGETVSRVPVPNVLSEGTRTVALSGDEIPAGDITVVAAYTAGDERQTTTASLLYSKYSPAPTSAITLTSIEFTRQGDVLTLDGDAANVGTSQVNSVVISVVKTDAVRPVEPNREYFIENIRPNRFTDFEATATIPTNIEQFPIRVQYTVDGQRVSSIIPIDVTDVRVQSGDSQNGGSPLFVIGIVLFVVAVAGVGVFRWRNQ